MKQRPIIMSAESVRGILDGRKTYRPRRIYPCAGEPLGSPERLRRRLLNGAIACDPEGCWYWIRARTAEGYGRLTVDRRTRFAHRLAYELFVGPVGDKHVCHSCDEPRCVNPSHLFLGTRSDNMTDAVRKGRLAPPVIALPGEKNPQAKLTGEQVRTIHRELQRGARQRSLAARFGVSQSTISLIKLGERW